MAALQLMKMSFRAGARIKKRYMRQAVEQRVDSMDTGHWTGMWVTAV